MAAFAAEHRDQSSFSIQIYCDSLLELDVCIVFKLHLIITREILYYYANKLKFMNKIFQLMACWRIAVHSLVSRGMLPIKLRERTIVIHIDHLTN